MLTNFYTIDTSTEQEGEYSYAIRLNRTHEVYQGHFPGMPVAPGVCLLRMIKECVSHALNASVRYQTISNCKFLSVVNPEKEERLELVFSLKDTCMLQAVVRAGEATVLKLKATLTPEQPAE